MQSDLERLSVIAVQRRAELERNVFQHPPQDWAEFQRRLGQWVELTGTLEEIKAIAKGEEDGTR